MRWSEIQEIKFNAPKSSKPISDLIDKPDHMKYLGAGWQSMVYALKNHPDKVAKISNIHDESDPIYQFVRVAKNHQNNPYFPKIYNAKMYPSIPQDEWDRDETMKNIDPNNWTPMQRKKILVYISEKLKPLSEVDDSVIRQLRVNMGIDPTFKKSRMGAVFGDPHDLAWLYKTTNDNNLKNAIRLMSPLFKVFATDLHDGNIMIRETTQGLQLVFVDPFSDNIDDGIID